VKVSHREKGPRRNVDWISLVYYTVMVVLVRYFTPRVISILEDVVYWKIDPIIDFVFEFVAKR